MKKIEFTALKDYNNRGLVITDLIFTSEEKRIEAIEKMNEVFTDIGLFTDGLKVVDLLFVDGHNLGKEGRHDWLMVLNDTIDKVDRDTRVNVCPDVEFIDKFMFNKKFDYTLYPEGLNNDGDTIYNANWKENWIEKYVRNDIADIVAAAVFGKK